MRGSQWSRISTGRTRVAADPARHGLEDWTIEQVSAIYKEMENTPDGDDAYHGRTGPFPIRHQRYYDLTTSLRGFIDAARRFATAPTSRSRATYLSIAFGSTSYVRSASSRQAALRFLRAK